MPARLAHASTPISNYALLWVVGMHPSALPAEIIQKILRAIGDDKKAALKAGLLSKFWLLHQRSSLLNTLAFKDEQDIVAFEDLTSRPTCTFPLPIECSEVSFQGLTDMTPRGAAAIEALLSRIIQTPRSMKIGLIGAQIPKPVERAMVVWGASLRELKISGGAHSPHTFFDTLLSLPHLESLVLQDFRFKPIKAWQRRRAMYSFPTTLKALVVIGNASLFELLLERVLEDGRIGNIETLSIESGFSRQDSGVPEILEIFRKLSAIPTIKLKLVYDFQAHTDFRRDIFGGPSYPLLKIRGLKHLEIDFSDTPAVWALDCLSFCALFLSTRRKGPTHVDIRIPRSLELWDEQGPAVQLEQLLVEMDHDHPSAGKFPKSTLVVRDFPADIPGQFKDAPKVCKYPVVFVNAAA